MQGQACLASLCRYLNKASQRAVFYWEKKNLQSSSYDFLFVRTKRKDKESSDLHKAAHREGSANVPHNGFTGGCKSTEYGSLTEMIPTSSAEEQCASRGSRDVCQSVSVCATTVVGLAARCYRRKGDSCIFPELLKNWQPSSRSSFDRYACYHSLTALFTCVDRFNLHDCSDCRWGAVSAIASRRTQPQHRRFCPASLSQLQASSSSPPVHLVGNVFHFSVIPHFWAIWKSIGKEISYFRNRDIW